MNKNWSDLHRTYQKQDWAHKPSQFAEMVLDYMPKQGTILDLGAGVGQDSVYFAKKGYDVTATDLDIAKLTETARGEDFSVEQVDLRRSLPFENESYDVVYAHLSLHYFNQVTTEAIFAEIYRVLKPGGIVAFFTNSTDDPEYDTGKQIEPDYFEIEGVPKRYLTVQTAKEFAHDFEVLLADNKGETYKDSAKGIHNLIRFIGRKPSD